MMKANSLVNIAATLGLCVASPTYANSHAFTTLDNPLAANPVPGSGTFAQGINDDGQVVGYYYDSSGNAHGFLFTRGGYTTLDDPSTVNNQTFPEGINKNGDIVGWYNDLSRDHGFVYSAGRYTTLYD
jgi:probable HAF family extracellular repeat protein